MRLHLFSCFFALSLGVLSLPCSAALFHRVVSLGDSLLDDSNGTRSPLASDQIASRLDAPLTKLAASGSTSTALIGQGQHTEAASRFGPGDLALLWIGGNDLFWSSPQVIFGNYDFIDTLASNVATTLSTLRGAGLEVLVFNLPDFAAVPAVQRTVDALFPFPFLRHEALENFTQATRFWNDRLDELAAAYGATVVNVYEPLRDAVAHPEDYALLGNVPVLAPHYGCPLCVFADSIHPSAFAQGWVANAALEQLNLHPNQQGTAPLPLLSQADLAVLAGIVLGDFDQNGQTDARDLAQWAASFSMRAVDETPLSHAFGNSDGDADVDGDDFLAWQRDFEMSASSERALRVTSGSAVPEPNALLMWLAMLGALARRIDVSRG